MSTHARFAGAIVRPFCVPSALSPSLFLVYRLLTGKVKPKSRRLWLFRCVLEPNRRWYGYLSTALYGYPSIALRDRMHVALSFRVTKTLGRAGRLLS